MLAGEHLRVAEQLLGSNVSSVRRDGFLLVCETANFVSAKLPKEYFLLARIYEGFVLPHIALANVESWKYPSRQRLIESAYSTFERAKESEKQVKMLEWLLSLGQKSKEFAVPKKAQTATVQIDLNTHDWARGTLASLLLKNPQASRAEIERAIQLLEEIESPQMSGFELLKPQAQKRLEFLSDEPKK